MAEEVKAGAGALNAMVAVTEEEAPPQLDHPALRETGNGPNVSYEEALLREVYGEPDADGVYGAGG